MTQRPRLHRLTTLDGETILVNMAHVSVVAPAAYGTELTLGAGDRSVRVSEPFDHVEGVLEASSEVFNG